MTEPLVVEVDGAEYLDRQNRIRDWLAKLKDPAGFDVEEWGRGMAKLQREVEPLPLVLGVRYRVRFLGGPPTTEHLHFEDQDGRDHPVDLPVIANAEYVEIEGVFRGRRASPFGTSSVFFDVAGQLAMLSDADVLRLEEIR